MSLTTKVSNIITQLFPDTEFFFASTFAANIQSFSVEALNMPLIILNNELPKEPEIKKNNNVHKNSRIIVSFLNVDSPDNTDLQSETIRSDMENMADLLAVKIYQLIECRPEGNQRYKLTPLFHQFASDLTGVNLEMNVIEQVIVNF